MKSKTSFFNKTIFFKTLTRFWPIWTLYLTILIFMMPVNLFVHTQLKAASPTEAASGPAESLENMLVCIQSNLKPVLVFLFAAFCAVAVFSYLNNVRSCHMIHALPVKRSELFITCYLDGILFLIAPQIIAFLLGMLVCIGNGITSVEYLFYWLVNTIGMSFFFYSLAVFCCMLTGQNFAALVYYVLVNIVYVAAKLLIGTLISSLCYGISGLSSAIWTTSPDVALSPVVYLTEKTGVSWTWDPTATSIQTVSFNGGHLVALYCIPACALAALALLLYRKRHLECVGDLLAFLRLQPVFRWLAAFGIGVGLALLIAEIFFGNSAFFPPVLFIFTALFCVVCFFIAEMLVCKRFKVFSRKRWLECGICAAILLAALGAIRGDLFGLEERIPKTGEIRAARVESDFVMWLTDAEELEMLTGLHQTLLDNKTSYRSLQSEGSVGLANLKIHYLLKNGKTLDRSYSVPVSEEFLSSPEHAAYHLADLETSFDHYLRFLVCDNYDEVSFLSGNIDFPNTNGDLYKTLDADEATALYEAMAKDIRCGNYPYGIRASAGIAPIRYYYSTISLNGITNGPARFFYNLDDSYFEHTKSVSDTDAPKGPYFPEQEPDRDVYVNFSFTESCSCTIQALIDLGIIESPSDLTPTRDPGV